MGSEENTAHGQQPDERQCIGEHMLHVRAGRYTARVERLHAGAAPEPLYYLRADFELDLWATAKIESLTEIIREILAVMDNGERTPEEMLLMERASNTVNK